MRSRSAVVACALAALVASPLLSHDFWLVPLGPVVAPGAELVVHGQTGSNFPGTLSAVTVDRIASARILTSTGEEKVNALAVSGNSLRLSHRPGARGQAVVEAAVHPRTLRESPASFRRYLTLEGAPEALERYERAGLMPTDSITRRYAKYAKALVEVGDGGPRAFQRRAGHPLEFVPVTDPAAAANGAALRLRMLFGGQPLAHARGHASVAAGVASDSAFHTVEFETDAKGEFTLAIAGKGLWNVRALHIVPAPKGSGADWDVHWATLVWWSSR